MNSTLPLYNWIFEAFGESVDLSRDSAAAACELSPVIYQLLAGRYPELVKDNEALKRFLSPSIGHFGKPNDMPGVAEAAELLLNVINAEGEIVVFGDFDADGVTATAILTSMIRYCGGNVRPFIPTREEGYGLSEAAVTRCLNGGIPALLITVDCGMGATASLQRFVDCGSRVIVTDHHIPGAELPREVIIISNHNEATPPDCRELCGAGIAFKLASGLVARRNPSSTKEGRAEREFLFTWIDALAIATVADVVALTGENRVIVSLGLRSLRYTKNEGLKALIKHAFEKNPPDGYTAYHLGFILGPHINSAGRMESADAALNLLLADDSTEATLCACKLKQTNFARKAETDTAFKEAEEIIKNDGIFDSEKDGAIVVSGKGWAPGVIGLLASRLADIYNRPAAVITESEDGLCRGSVRAPQGYNAYDALSACKTYLTHFGGHAQAAGLGLKSEDIVLFREAFSDNCFKQIGAAFIRPTIEIAGELDIGVIDSTLLESLQRLEPYGEGNPEPLWKLSGMSVKARKIGKGEMKSLALTLLRGNLSLEAIWFKMGEYERLFSEHSHWDFVGTLMKDNYYGEERIKLVVKDARPATLD